jgi:hypothetical protein
MNIDIKQINKTGVLKGSCIPDTDNCGGHEAELKSIVTYLCGLPKYQQLQDCILTFSGATTQASFNELVKDYLCEIEEQLSDLTSNIFTYDTCEQDNWNTSLTNHCLNPDDNTTVDVLQVLVARVITLSAVIKNNEINLNLLTQQVNNQQTQINNIENNCCNITLINRIQSLEARLAAANIP